MVKNMRKLTILMIAVVAIGTFALPNVLTASQGQHQFNPGSAVQCTKCHGPNNADQGVALELNSSGLTDYGLADGGDPDNLAQWTASGYIRGKKIHVEVGCAGCHTVTKKAAGDGRPTLTTDTHVGVLRDVNCRTCHGHVVTAGQELQGADEVHNNAVVGIGGATGLAGVGDAACIGCHTAVGVTGSVSYGFTPAQQLIGSTGLTIKATP